MQHLTIETNCAMLRAQARDGRDRAQSLMSSGVVGPSEAVRPQPQRRSDASRACAAGAARFLSLGTHLLTRAAPALRLTNIPLVLTAPRYSLCRPFRGGVEADLRNKYVGNLSHRTCWARPQDHRGQVGPSSAVVRPL